MRRQERKQETGVRSRERREETGVRRRERRQETGVRRQTGERRLERGDRCKKT